MMKFLKLIVILSFLTSCNAQESKLIIGKRLASDWSSFPIYPHLIEDVDGSKELKKEYQFLDDIEVHVFRYLSDGLGVQGMIVAPKKEGKYPCVIYNRGGNRDFGSLKMATAANILGKIAKEGYVVIASQYRGNGGSEGIEEFGGKDVNDVLNLIDVLGELENTDTDNIGMYGWSRGGMMTYLALTQTNRIKAAIVGGALSDLTEIDRPEIEESVYAELIPDYYENKEAELKKRSAIHQVNRFPKDVPILMLHGSSDWRVKSTQPLELALEFEKYRIPYRLKIFEGGDHSITEHREEVNAEVLNWLDRFLKNGESLPNMEFHGR